MGGRSKDRDTAGAFVNCHLHCKSVSKTSVADKRLNASRSRPGYRMFY